MKEPLVLTFDIGTQSARGLLVAPDGSFEDVYQVKYEEPYYSRNPGWAEQRPDFYYDRICDIGKTLCARNTEKMGRIIAVTLTTIRDTVLCLDKNNEPLRDIILCSTNVRLTLITLSRGIKALYSKSQAWRKQPKSYTVPQHLTGLVNTSPIFGKKLQNMSCCLHI